jgi:RNA polymerase sigma factor (TIGR02999 family)
MSDPQVIEDLLRRMREGDPDASAELFTVLAEELHSMARRHMVNQPGDHTLQPTALVNEAWMKIACDGQRQWADRTHFLSVASTAMRQVLVDHARRKAALKRGGKQTQVELDGLILSMEDRSGGMLELDETLQRLERRDPLAARVVELHFFGGCNFEEIGAILGLSERQAYRTWAAARVLLAEERDLG